MPTLLTRRRFWVITAAGIALLAIAGVALVALVRDELDPGAPVPGVTAVAVRDNIFSPAAIQIEPGQTVTWTWEGDEDHNVVGDSFESPTQSDGTFAHTFAARGTYDYECTLHFFMRGEVVVQ